MKTIYALVVALFASSAIAQSANPKHMFEFNADSVLRGLISFDKSKTPGSSADNDTQLDLNLNYAYALSMFPNLQLGSRIKYQKGTDVGRGDFEDYGLEVGGIWNFATSMETLDLANSAYVSLYLGLGWANNYGNDSSINVARKDEVLSSTVALGKRFGLTRWGLNHVVYSPEIALENTNSTTGSALEYSQNIQFRFLQFSVFF